MSALNYSAMFPSYWRALFGVPEDWESNVSATGVARVADRSVEKGCDTGGGGGLIWLAAKIISSERGLQA